MGVEQQDNVIRTTVSISSLEQGMTVEVNGQCRTVSRKDIRHDDLLGWSYLGDASKKTITKIQFAVTTANGIQIRG